VTFLGTSHFNSSYYISFNWWVDPNRRLWITRPVYTSGHSNTKVVGMGNGGICRLTGVWVEPRVATGWEV